MKFWIFTFSLWLIIEQILGKQAYMTTCGGKSGCGVVGNCSWTNYAIAPTEGMFGISCTCPYGLESNPTCYFQGKALFKCKNSAYPTCSAPCNKKICLTYEEYNVTGLIVSACPLHHPQNVDDCCLHKTDAWCQCALGNPNIDTATAIYDALGGRNAFIDYREC